MSSRDKTFKIKITPAPKRKPGLVEMRKRDTVIKSKIDRGSGNGKGKGPRYPKHKGKIDENKD